MSGWTNSEKALKESADILSLLPHKKFISIGGYGDEGYFTESSLAQLEEDINQGRFSQYDGIVFSLGRGASNLQGAFAQVFAAAKTFGLIVGINVAKFAPIYFFDFIDLLRGFFANRNIDFISPNLFTNGENPNEEGNDFSPIGEIPWSEYGNAQADIVPSILTSSLYDSAQSFFSSQGVEVEGYIEWN